MNVAGLKFENLYFTIFDNFLYEIFEFVLFWQDNLLRKAETNLKKLTRVPVIHHSIIVHLKT